MGFEQLIFALQFSQFDRPLDLFAQVVDVHVVAFEVGEDRTPRDRAPTDERVAHLHGIGRGASATRKPLVVRFQAPRFFVVGDEVTLSVNLNNRTDEPLVVRPVHLPHPPGPEGRGDPVVREGLADHLNSSP